MPRKSHEYMRQQDDEIVRCVQLSQPVTGYRVTMRIKAPRQTIYSRLQALVDNHRLDCVTTKDAKFYSIPGSKLKAPIESGPAKKARANPVTLEATV